MKFKRIEIQGFKSFADKVSIEFKNGICAIVGPNGSGKSNISDAVRWVLGEQSVKTLRGSKMEDVIFSGTDKRSPLGYAEVNITFDNNDGTIPIDFQEVTVTRRMFRNGESEYYINKSGQRLKDIRQLFMDTGVGKEGYSIIGQGRIDEILSNRPEERRNVIEEASGIVKFKYKKEESEKKLEKTKNNLVRINDIIYELNKQVDYLRKQSNKAKLSLDISNRLKKLEISISIEEYNKINSLLEESNLIKNNILGQLKNLEEEKDNLSNDLLTTKQKINKLNNKILTSEGKLHDNTQNINKNNTEISLWNEKLNFNKKDTERISKEILKMEDKLRGIETEIETLLISKLEEEKTILEMEKDLEIHLLIMDKNSSELKSIEGDLDDKKNKLSKMSSDLANKNNDLKNYKAQVEGIVANIEKINKANKDLNQDILDIKEEINNFVNKEKELKDWINLEEQKLRDKTKEESDLKIALDNQYKIFNRCKSDLQEKNSTYNLIKNMVDEYDGYYKSVKNLMLLRNKNSNIKNKIRGVIGELISVKENYEKAIEISLGSSIQNIVTNDEYDAKYLIDYLKHNKLGRATFLPLTNIKGSTLNFSPVERERNKIIGLAWELVTFDEEYINIIKYLLGRTIVMDDLDDAIVFSNKYNQKYRIVTLDGDLINPGGSMVGGSLAKNVGNLINRDKKLYNISCEINKLVMVRQQEEDKLEAYKSKIDLLNKEIINLEESIKKREMELIHLTNNINNLGLQINILDENINKNQDDLNRLDLGKKECNMEIANLVKEVDILYINYDKLDDYIRNLHITYNSLNEKKEYLDKEYYNNQISLNNSKNKLLNIESKIKNFGLETESIKENIESKNKDLLDLSNEKTSIGKNLEILEAEISKLETLELNIQEEHNFLLMERDNLMEENYDKQERVKILVERISKLEKDLNSWEIKDVSNNIKIENIIEKLGEDYGISIDEVDEFLIDIKNLSNSQKEARDLKEKLKNIGSVSFDSIDEYSSLREKLDFMEKQRDDLILAKSDIHNMIKTLEKNMKDQFIESFHIIRGNFKRIFRILFDGGDADLVLDNQDVLTSGIEIIAQPPGKRLQNISLLSGGEKSLTAVALLFAILETRPAPFCILDEIDASLDESNINRYTKYLKMFSDSTQFIIITHRKSTMEIADILHGITMEEEGISKVVSVKLSEKSQGKVTKEKVS